MTNPRGDDIEPRLRRFFERTFADEFLGLSELRRLSQGASQETYCARTKLRGGERLFAVRRAAGGLEQSADTRGAGLRTEAELMRIARGAGIPEPRIVGLFEPSDGLGDGFIMEWLDGETLGARINRSPAFDAVRPRLAFQCGQILARIHALDVEHTALAERLRVKTTEQFIRETLASYQGLGTVQPMIDATALWLLDHVPPCETPRLVHNDFRNGNLMVSPAGIIAVLDWEIAHRGDPMRDLGWICCNSWRFGGDLPVGGFGTKEQLFAGYQSVSGQPVDAESVTFWEIFGSFWWAVGTLGMAQQYRMGPDRTVERPAIGRRSSECQMDCVNILFPGPFELAGPGTGAAPKASALPHRGELLASVRDFLRGDLREELSGRNRFLALVASNSIDIALREDALGGDHEVRELRSLEGLLGASHTVLPETGRSRVLESALATRRQELAARLHDRSMALADRDLQAHLRQTVAQNLALDQPGYSALRPVD